MGDDSGDTWEINTRLIAEKFIRYYWRQCVPYIPSENGRDKVLKQNTGRKAAIIRSVSEVRAEQNSISLAMGDRKKWKKFITKVHGVVLKQPLWKLQTVGGAELPFLYENRRRGGTIELRPGVAYCFRQFHGLVTELVRNSWLLHIRRHNTGILGTESDLSEFLFGGERRNVTAVLPVLREIQEGCCFYCSGSLRRRSTQVDHFIAWSRYPVDLGHNFVLAHRKCNSAKSDHLPAAEYLSRWSKRNKEFGAQLGDAFDRIEVPHNLSISASIARWAYEQAEAVEGLTWVRGKELVPLGSGWEEVFGMG